MFCSNCGSSMKPNDTFCPGCGTKNISQITSDYDDIPAKSMDISTDYSTSSNEGYRSKPPEYRGREQDYPPPQSARGYTPNVPYVIYPSQRNFFLWLILGICTFGIASIVYLYHNFNDVRKLETALHLQSSNRMMRSRTSDPWIGIIAYFVCSPVAYIMKYSNLNGYISSYGDRFYDPAPATPGKLIGIWVLIFFTFLFGIIIIPLLLVSFGLVFYVIYMEKQWQDCLNYQISKMMMQTIP